MLCKRKLRGTSKPSLKGYDMALHVSRCKCGLCHNSNYSRKQTLGTSTIPLVHTLTKSFAIFELIFSSHVGLSAHSTGCYAAHGRHGKFGCHVHS